MSIKNEIERIQFNVSSAYEAVKSKGGELPNRQDSDNLPAAIASIPSGTEAEITWGDTLTESDGVIDVATPVNGIISQSDFNALSEEQRGHGLWVVSDGGDSGNSGGVSSGSNVYSLEETRIGTWIDGRPLYRKVAIGTTGGYAVVTPITKIDDVDIMVSVHWILIAPTASRESIIPGTSPNLQITYMKDDNTLSSYVIIGEFANKDITLIAEYTKTTDEATIDISDAVASARAKAGFDSQFSYEQSTDGIYASYASGTKKET